MKTDHSRSSTSSDDQIDLHFQIECIKVNLDNYHENYMALNNKYDEAMQRMKQVERHVYKMQEVQANDIPL